MSNVIKEDEMQLHGQLVRLQYKQVKNITLRLKEDGAVYVTVPLGLSKKVLQQFLFEKEPWLRAKLLEQQQRGQQPHYQMGELPFDGSSVWLWGKRLPAKFVTDVKKSGSYEVNGDIVYFYYRLPLAGQARASFVEFFYKQEVFHKGASLMSHWKTKMFVQPTGLKVHMMKSRWGSCNVRSGSINLNTLLACWPQECLEYIVVHELAHLLEANHSPRFHALVGSFLPDWRSRKQLLESFQPL